MSDISQHALICTLQRLREHPRLTEELTALGQERPMTLILPCHAGEFERPALAAILDELSPARFLSRVVIPVNGARDAAHVGELRAFLAGRLALPHRLLWCDPALAPMREVLPAFHPGKGSNVWLALGWLAREDGVDGGDGVVLLADGDVTTFRLEMLGRLAYALVEPGLGFTFAKSYYPRVTDRIYGRVSRLFVAPLLAALVRAGGHLPLLDFLRSFRYPLAGECGMTLELALSLPLEAGWGLETGMLCELFRRIDPRRVCQVDAGIRYDHKHQPLGDGRSGLLAMTGEIAHTLLAHLAREGIRPDRAFHEAVAASFRLEAAEALRRSAAMAKINALRFPAQEEEQTVDLFTRTLSTALEEVLSPSVPIPPPLPAWQRAPEAVRLAAGRWLAQDEVL